MLTSSYLQHYVFRYTECIFGLSSNDRHKGKTLAASRPPLPASRGSSFSVMSRQEANFLTSLEDDIQAPVLCHTEEAAVR